MRGPQLDLCCHQVYTMVAYVITEQTNMMYGRQLDQVILCALYGVCKVNQLRQITFKDIITHYKKQAQAKNSIFRTVSIRLRPDLSVASSTIHRLTVQSSFCRSPSKSLNWTPQHVSNMPGPLS